MTGRDVARKVLERVAQQKAWATLALDAELKVSGLDERERRFASELTYGVLRHQQRLDDALARHADVRRTPPKVVIALRVAAYQLLLLDRVPPYAVVDDAVTVAKKVGGAKLGGFVNAVLRKVVSAGFAPLPTDLADRASAEYSMPRWIVDEVAAALGDDAAAQLHAAIAGFTAQPTMTLRANRQRISADDLVAALSSEGVEASRAALSTDGVVVRSLGDPSKHPRFLAGEFAIQDLGAQRVAELAAPGATDHILDACAGVGGKACHLAELQGDAGQIDAADLSGTKLGLLRASAQRLGHRSIRCIQADLIAGSSLLAASYPLIVLDAPCSGLGVLRRHPDAKWRLTAESVAPLVALQAALLDALIPRLAPGGALVYSVCSFTNREGPAQIAAALARQPTLQLVAEERTWPHRDECDAFYLAKLQRRA